MPPSHSNISWQEPDGKKPAHIVVFFTALLIILSIYIIKEPVSTPVFKIPFVAAILICRFFLPKPLFNPIFWISCLAYFIFILFQSYYGVANHHFVACYLMMAIILFTSGLHKDDRILQFHIRFILLVVLLFSAIHKTLSAPYLNGTFFQFEMYMDVFLKPLKEILPGWSPAISQNLEAYQALKAQAPQNLKVVFLREPINHAAAISRIFSWLSILMEAVAAIFMFWKSKKNISHFLLLATVAGVFFFRLETGFLALLSCMGLMLSPTTAWRNAWLFAAILFAAMMATGAGIR